MTQAGAYIFGLLCLLSLAGCLASPAGREENDKLIARCYEKARPEAYKARGGETVAAVVEGFYNYLTPYLVSDVTKIIAEKNQLTPRSILKKEDALQLPPPVKLLRPTLRIARVAPRETGLLLEAWDKYRVHDCGLVDIVIHHEHKGGNMGAKLLLPDRFVEISSKGAHLLKKTVESLEKKRVKGEPPGKALGQLRSIGFGITGTDEYVYDERSLKMSKELDMGLQRFAYALDYLEEWAQ